MNRRAWLSGAAGSALGLAGGALAAARGGGGFAAGGRGGAHVAGAAVPPTREGGALVNSEAGAQATLAALGASIGLQLYTLRGPLAEDVPGTLASVAEIGYHQVELAGLHGATASGFRAHLDRAGLAAPSGHVSIDEVRTGLDRLLEDAATLGVATLVVPWLAPSERTAEGYRRVADDLNRAGERAAGAGVAVAYHNNDFELARTDGPSGWDLILDLTDPALVSMQMDVFWAVAGGADPLAYLREHAGRFTSLHAKDRTRSGDMVAVGEGAIDYPAILAAAAPHGLTHVFVEHDEPRDPLASARASYDHLATLEI